MSHINFSVHFVTKLVLTEKVFGGPHSFRTLNLAITDREGEKSSITLYDTAPSGTPLRLEVESAELVIFPQKELDDGTPA